MFACVCASSDGSSGAVERMLRRTLPHLLLLWSLGEELSTASAPRYADQEQSWRHRSLHSVPQELDVNLRRLDLSNNFIRQLRTLGLPHLKQLDLSGNLLDLISERVFDNPARLEELNLSKNALHNNLGGNSEALRSVSGLRVLDMSMNGLSGEAVELYLRNKPSLHRLRLTGNCVTRLSHGLFRECKALRTVSLDNNLITDIEPGTFESLELLETLNLARNNLAHICDFRLHQVKHLNLSRNSIEFFVTRKDERLYRLEILDLSYNKLFYFPIVPKVSHLRYLHLQNNMVGSLDSEATMISEAKSLYKEILSEGAAAAAAESDEIYSNWWLMPLVYIDLSYNHFRSFPLETLGLLTSLETLNLSYNCLQNITFDSSSGSQLGNRHFFPRLRCLDLGNNGLEYVSPLSLEAFPQLETLNLRANSVKPCSPADTSAPSEAEHSASCVALGQMRRLKHLNLEENHIRTLRPRAFEKTSLVSLKLARNPGMAIAVGALEGVRGSLQSLSLSGINASGRNLSLPCLPALTALNISNNRLDAAPGGLGCSPLKELDISNNRFMSLNRSLIRDLSSRPSAVYIRGNHFNCCDALWPTVFSEPMMKVADADQARCVAYGESVAWAEYLKNPSVYCSLHAARPVVTYFHAFVVFLFVLVFFIFVTLGVFIQRGCCHLDGVLV